MGAIKTMKEVESALPQKKEINYVRALDKDGNPILISKDVSLSWENCQLTPERRINDNSVYNNKDKIRRSRVVISL